MTLCAIRSLRKRERMIAATENQIQHAVFEHLRRRAAPGVFAFHPRNGGRDQRGRGRAINAGLGVVAGVPDVIAIYRGSVYAIELKTEKGRASEQQLEAIERIRNAGAHACICYGLDRALRCLEAWGLLVGEAA